MLPEMKYAVRWAVAKDEVGITCRAGTCVVLQTCPGM